jgi:hypothetical protein
MNSGWLFGDGELYIKHQKDVVSYLRKHGGDYELDGLDRPADDLLQAAFELDICHWTEWEDEDDYQYTTKDHEDVVARLKFDNGGDGVEWERWVDPKDGTTYKVPISIYRDWDNMEPIQSNDE